LRGCYMQSVEGPKAAPSRFFLRNRHHPAPITAPLHAGVLKEALVKRKFLNPSGVFRLRYGLQPARRGWSSKCAPGHPSNKEQCERVPGERPELHQSRRRYRGKIAALVLTLVDSASALRLFALKLAVVQEGNPALFNATARFE
jgi:hypothetical protein